MVRDLKLGRHSDHGSTRTQKNDDASFHPSYRRADHRPGRVRICDGTLELDFPDVGAITRLSDVEIDHSLCRAPFAGRTHTHIQHAQGASELVLNGRVGDYSRPIHVVSLHRRTVATWLAPNVGRITGKHCCRARCASDITQTKVT